MGTSAVVSTFDFTSLFAGEPPVRQLSITLGAGQNAAPVNNIPTPLVRGTLLGRSSTGEASSAAKAGGNTGNGTLTLAGSPILTGAIPGIYKVAFTAPTTFTVTDPNGNALGTGGTVGTAFANEISFNTAAGGTAFVAGDGFNITVVPSDEYVICKATATDGSQVPVAVLAADTDTSAGAVNTSAYFNGEFAGEIMTIDPSWTITTLQAALRQALSQIYVRSVGILG